MPKNGRFMVGLVGVATAVTYLIWTGVSDTMVFYLTPTELVERIETDPSFRDVGVKVSGEVVPNSYEQISGTSTHRFRIVDPENPEVSFAVLYDGVRPDTFNDRPDMKTEAILEGRFDSDGVFVATTLLTKCGSRYEASPEELHNSEQMTQPAPADHIG